MNLAHLRTVAVYPRAILGKYNLYIGKVILVYRIGFSESFVM